MTENPERINQLIERLEMLSRQQELFSKEIYALRNELYQLKAVATHRPPLQSPQKETDKPVSHNGFKVVEDIERFADKISTPVATLQPGPEQLISKQTVQSKAPLFQNKSWLWAILLAIMLILGWFSIKMMRKAT
jgi:hypothetical protein